MPQTPQSVKERRKIILLALIVPLLTVFAVLALKRESNRIDNGLAASLEENYQLNVKAGNVPLDRQIFVLTQKINTLETQATKSRLDSIRTAPQIRLLLAERSELEKQFRQETRRKK